MKILITTIILVLIYIGGIGAANLGNQIRVYQSQQLEDSNK